MNVWLVRRRLRLLRQEGQVKSGGLLALRFGIIGLVAILLSFLATIVVICASIFFVYSLYAKDLASSQLTAEEVGRRSAESSRTTRLYDRSGEVLLYELTLSDGGRRTAVSLSTIPEYLRDGTIALEDKTFYTNPAGINIEGFGRAVWGVVTGEYAGGGSSITQQLVRNVIMTYEERTDTSPFRKVKEMVLSYELTRLYPGLEGRDKILEMYLNNISYGRQAYGVEAAAQIYFGKHVEELSLAECAMIVPLGNSPALNPIDDYESAKSRQEICLDQMFLQGYITAEEAQAAKAEELTIAQPNYEIKYPHFSLYVRDQLEELYIPGLEGNKLTTDQIYGGGLTVITTLDVDAQEKAQQVVTDEIAEMKESKNATNAAVVVLDTKTAEVLAMVGSADYNDASISGEVNMAISPRSPGSSFKPFTYATAFAQGYTPATVLMDVRTSFDDPGEPQPYVPENYMKNYNGPVTVRKALAWSLNIPAVAMLDKVGVENVVTTARAMGISTLDEPEHNLSLTLGGYPVRVLDMAYAFSVFANGGVQVGTAVDPESVKEGYRTLDPVCILKVADADGKVLYEYTEPEKHSVISPQVAFLINSILSDNQARTFFRSHANMELEDRPAGVKTGTSNDFRDAWTVGYTPQYVTAVWVGNADNSQMHASSESSPDGSTTAAPIWKPIMEYLHEGKAVEDFSRPEGIVTAIVDSESGKLPTEYSTSRIQEIFIEGTVPTEYDDVHKAYRICKVTGKLATEFCPADQVETVVYSIYPAEAADWVRENNIAQPPTEICDLHGPYLGGSDVAITSPTLLAPVSGLLSIIGNARVSGMSKYWIEIGQGMSPGQWQMIGPEHGNSVSSSVLETWDTKGYDGLYTLRLSVSGSGGVSQATVPVVVDNITPTVSILPFDYIYDADDVDKSDLDKPNSNYFRMGMDEWTNIQVDALDNVAMDRVEFFLDNRSLGFSTVAPYTMRWTLSMSATSGTIPAVDLTAGSTTIPTAAGTLKIEVTRGEDSTIYTETLTPPAEITTTQSITQIIVYSDGTRDLITPSGKGIRQSADGYAEIHTVYVIAYDKAGNQTKSASARFVVRPAKSTGATPTPAP